MCTVYQANRLTDCIIRL